MEYGIFTTEDDFMEKGTDPILIVSKICLRVFVENELYLAKLMACKATARNGTWKFLAPRFFLLLMNHVVRVAIPLFRNDQYDHISAGGTFRQER